MTGCLRWHSGPWQQPAAQFSRHAKTLNLQPSVHACRYNAGHRSVQQSVLGTSSPTSGNGHSSLSGIPNRLFRLPESRSIHNDVIRLTQIPIFWKEPTTGEPHRRELSEVPAQSRQTGRRAATSLQQITRLANCDSIHAPAEGATQRQAARSLHWCGIHEYR